MDWKKYKLEEKFLTSVVMFKRKINGDQATLPWHAHDPKAYLEPNRASAMDIFCENS